MMRKLEVKSVIAVLTASAILAGCTVANAQTVATDTAVYKESAVARGDITVGINETATATINAVTHSFDADGEVEEIYVKAGQEVKKGDLIAKISVEDLQSEINKLELSYNQAEVKLEQAKINKQLTSLNAEYEYTTNKNLEETAPLEYSQTISELEHEIDSTRDSLDTAREKYDYYKAKVADTGYYTDYNIEGLLVELNAWKAEVARIEKAIEEAGATGSADDVTNLEAELTEAKKSLTTAQNSYNTNYEKYQNAFEKAETEMESLSKNIDSLRSQYNQTYNSADATKTQAQYELDESLEKSKNADSLYQIQVAQLDSEIKSQELSLKEALAELNELKNSMGETSIKAQCDGIVMSVGVKAGDSVTKNDVIATIADETEVYVMTSIAQEDISEIAIGKNAEIVFDAYPEETITGVVDSITTTPARTSSSTVSYQVTVLLDGEVGRVFEGMTGNITFVAKQVKDVLYVSNRAVITEDTQQYVKLKQEDGTLTKTEVTTGFSDGRNCEIKSGLKEGDIVVIESVVSQK